MQKDYIFGMLWEMTVILIKHPNNSQLLYMYVLTLLLCMV